MRRGSATDSIRDPELLELLFPLARQEQERRIQLAPYNFISWVIGINLTVEHGVKFVYENTVGRLTQSIAGSDTEADRFIAKSWNNYAKTLYQTSDGKPHCSTTSS